jgi:N-acyl-D-glutamate deacylase
MTKLYLHAFCLLAAAFLSVTAQAADYDIVILNGRVMDPETKMDAVRNVGVKDGKIAVITDKKISGKETINAKGHVVSPGFIDPHTHGIELSGFSTKIMLRDGVTTQMEMEVGVYPVDEFYEQRQGKWQANFGASVGHMPYRMFLLDGVEPKGNGFADKAVFPALARDGSKYESAVPTEKQLQQIVAAVEEGFKQGGLGLGIPVGYELDGTSTAEINAITEVAGEYNSFVTLHGRFSSQRPPVTGVTGTNEVLAAAMLYGAGLYVHHYHAQGLDRTPDITAVIEKARDEGHAVIGGVYPYTYGSSIAAAPYLQPANYGPNMGHSYEDIIEVPAMKPLTKERYEDLVKNDPGHTITFKHATDEVLAEVIALPGVTIESDGMPWVDSTGATMAWDADPADAKGHPRGSGTRGLTLRMVREGKWDISLMDAISKMSYLHAQYFEPFIPQMKTKGRLQKGMDADITIFDPETVTDNGTPTQGALPTTGIPYVIVNGTVVVKDSKVLKDVYPGQAIRNPVSD